MADLPPSQDQRLCDTVRLIPSRFAEREDSVLAPLARDHQDLQALFALDNATNRRLQGEAGRLPGIGVHELVFGVPHFRIVNAAFTYAHPQGSRFNGPHRGAWYAARTLQTAVAEVAFHKAVEYAEIQHFHDEVHYVAYLADIAGELHDLRGDAAWQTCLNPASYIESQALAQRLLDQGALGLIYPSVRDPAGTNVVCFRPAAVGHVRRAQSVTLRWNGSPLPDTVIEQ